MQRSGLEFVIDKAGSSATAGSGILFKSKLFTNNTAGFNWASGIITLDLGGAQLKYTRGTTKQLELLNADTDGITKFIINPQTKFVSDIEAKTIKILDDSGNEKITLNKGGTSTFRGKLTITTGGLTITAGGETITAGDLTLNNGNISASGNITTANGNVSGKNLIATTDLTTPQITIKNNTTANNVTITPVSGSKKISVDGEVTATKVWNAVYNGFGEICRKAPETKISYGDVVCIDEYGLVNKVSSEDDFTRIIGICSNTIGIGTGGDDIPEDEQVEVEMMGKIFVKTNCDIKAGQLVKVLADATVAPTLLASEKFAVAIEDSKDGMVRVLYK